MTVRRCAPSSDEQSLQQEAARLVWLVRRRGLRPLPDITHSAWIASVVARLRGEGRDVA
jgi:hypothetical protein